MVDMDQNVLAAAASVSRGVIIDFEKGRRTPGKNNLTAIRAALEAAGVEFINHSGVRLRT
ncbi:helix-turn-helix transcriptional regulator [Mesorhizobium sp. 8]|nr:helix-turn-helix transcriptional regulator [Mesorhizobium sp. 8]